MPLYHFSEEPDLSVFKARTTSAGGANEPSLVWAIDDWHAPMYFVPRQCPRACFWAGPQTSKEDRDRWLNRLDPRFVMVVESDWLDRIRNTKIYRYSMPEGTFVLRHAEAGHYVSRQTVVPAKVEEMGDLLSAITGAGVELRITPRLGPMWKQVHRESTLCYSGTRLRNAAGYPDEFRVEHMAKEASLVAKPVA